MKIDNYLMVSIIYELRENDSNGNVIEKLDESKPLQFIYGTGRLLPAFESNLAGYSQGENFSFSLTSDDAYGERREEMIIDVPVTIFHADGKIDENVCQVGNTVPMRDSNGNQLNGIILEISPEFVRMDFNHPMAGVDLFFSGRVTEVREPLAEELNPTGSSCSSCGSGHSGCSGSC